MAMENRSQEIFTPEFRFGLGGVPIGNEFKAVTDESAERTLQASWDAGVRYFDVSPWYGLGLAERRYGRFLYKHPRDSYVISTKVGKLLKASPHNNAKTYFPGANSPNNVIFDYTADGVKRSIEDSLQRMGIDSIDVVFVHDLSPDNKLLPAPLGRGICRRAQGSFSSALKDARGGCHQSLGCWRERARAHTARDSGVGSGRLLARFAVFVDRPRQYAEQCLPGCAGTWCEVRHGLSAKCRLYYWQPALQLWVEQLEHSAAAYRQARAVARCRQPVWRRSQDSGAAVFSRTGCRGCTRRRRLHRSPGGGQRSFDERPHSTRLLGRIEASATHRTECAASDG